MKYLGNFHSHSDFCDGRGPMERFVLSAIEKNLTAFGVSSHAPVPFATSWAMKEDNVDDYIQEFDRLKTKYAESISLYLGLEIDYFAVEKVAGFEAVKNLPLDYRIGSIHFMDPLPDGTRWIIDGNPHKLKVATEKIYNGDIKKAIERYFELSEEMIQSASFDIIGHMDKIIANAMQFPEFDMNSKWYKNLLYSIFTLIKEKGIIVEINTKSLFGKGITFPNQQSFKQLKEMNIPVMVNSDCHHSDKVLDSFDEANTMLKEVGFKHVMGMVNGIWDEVPIN